MTEREPGMVEVIGGVVGHADFFHDAAGAEIGGNGEGDKFLERERTKSVAHNGASAFRGKSLAPEIGGKPPADFDARSEVRVERRDVKADEAEEGRVRGELRGVKAEAMFGEVRFDATEEFIAFAARERAGHEFHDARVGVDVRERLAVGFPPAAEEQSFRLQDGHSGGWGRDDATLNQAD